MTVTNTLKKYSVTEEMNPINITVGLTIRLMIHVLTNATPFAHNLTIRKTRTTKSVETKPLFLSKIT